MSRIALNWSLLACLAACQGGVMGGGDPGGPGPGDGGAAISTEVCTFAPRGGSARGSGRAIVTDPATPFDLSEALCTTLHARNGSVTGIRFAFGPYDPRQPEARVPLLIEPLTYSGAPLVSAFTNAYLLLPSVGEVGTSGTLDFDPATNHGAFKSVNVNFTFDCDPADDLSGTPGPAAPDLAAPGTAIVTRGGPEDVFILDGVRCLEPPDHSLSIERIDHGPACSFSQLALDPSSSEPVLGQGTYPAYFNRVSTIFTAFDLRSFDSRSVDGTLEVSTAPPYRGFATFVRSPGSSPDRVEFACSL